MNQSPLKIWARSAMAVVLTGDNNGTFPHPPVPSYIATVCLNQSCQHLSTAWLANYIFTTVEVEMPRQPAKPSSPGNVSSSWPTAWQTSILRVEHRGHYPWTGVRAGVRPGTITDRRLLSSATWPRSSRNCQSPSSPLSSSTSSSSSSSSGSSAAATLSSLS
jgi:hypothetical protein